MDVRALVEKHLAGWRGEHAPLSRAWVEALVTSLDSAHRPIARLALLAARAAYQVDDQLIADFRAVMPDDKALLQTVAWASFAATRRIASWFPQDMTVDRREDRVMPDRAQSAPSEFVRLHHAHGTRALRARWMLEELGIAYELKSVDLRAAEHKSAEHLKLHPLGKVPALEIDGTVNFESLAILLYLADQFWEKDLAPVIEERRQRAEYLTWMAFSTGTLEPAILEQVRARKANEQGLATVDLGPATTSFEAAAQCVESKLADQPFLLGDRFNAADIMNGSMMIWAETMGLLAPYPKINSWVARLKARPAYRRAMSK